MGVSELTEHLKTAFEYKNNGDYKQSIDYFYKALAIDNESTEIMSELASLYSKLCRYERSISFYEQILQKDNENNDAKYKLAYLLKITKDYKRAEEILTELYNAGFNIEETAVELFFIMVYNHKYGRIITSFNKYSKRLKNSSALYFVALAHSELGNKNTADEFFRKSFNNDEKNILPGIEIANRLLEKGKKEEAKQFANRLLKYTEDDRIYYLLAEIEYSDGNLENAIKYYSYAIKINPKKAKYYFRLALTFSLKGFFKEAEESYCKAINLDSGNETYNYALAYMYYITAKYELAEKITDYLLYRNPDNMQAVSLKILILTENNKNQFAGKLIEKLEQEINKDDFAYYSQAIYYSKLNLWEKASEAIREALKLNKDSLEYNYQSAKFNYELGKADEAKHICEKILKENPKYIQAYILLSKICYAQKDYIKAQSLINKVMELDKNIAEAYSLNAAIYIEQKNYEKAIEQYKIAASISPDNEEYYAKIAECYYKSEQYKDAYAYYKEAADFNITMAKYRYYMAKCSELTNDNENALSNYSFAKRLAPSNTEYLKDYAQFLYKIGKKRDAVNLLKSIKKQMSTEAAEDIKSLIKKYK